MNLAQNFQINRINNEQSNIIRIHPVVINNQNKNERDDNIDIINENEA